MPWRQNHGKKILYKGREKMRIELLKGVNTLEELKALYKKLAMKFHPDRGGDLETMKKLNNEYDSLFLKLKNIHTNAKGETYEKETTETPEQWKDIVNQLINLNLQNVKIEVIGSFLWLSGETKPYREDLKAIGFRWSSNKTAWYLAPEGYKKTSRKKFAMDDIRNLYGSDTIKPTVKKQIA